MSEDADLLSFLVEGLVGPQRDVVMRAFYRYAEGDPKSGPVNEAVLLTACSRRLALAPKELQEGISEFRKLLAEAREMEARSMKRVEWSNASVVASFKDEAERVSSGMRVTIHQSERIVSEGRHVAETMQKLLVQGESLATTLQLTKLELKAHNDSTKKIAEATANNKAISESTKEMVSSLTGISVANWLTIGIGIGFVLTVIATQLPWWGIALLYGVPIGLLQLVAGGSWTDVKNKAETMRTTDRSK